MNSIEQILSRLEPLSASDRRWIIERLPESAKVKLIDGAMEPVANALPSDAPSTNELQRSSRTLSELEPQIVAELLALEVACIAASVLRAGSLLWRSRIIELLPVTYRSNVKSLLHEPEVLSDPVVDSLVRALSRRAREVPWTAMPVKQLFLRRWLDKTIACWRKTG